MSGGAFQVSREIFDNEIWSDVVKFRIFFYILGKAIFSSDGYTQAGIHLERGQYLRSMRNLQADLAFREGRGNAVKEYPLTTIQRKIKSLEKEGRITTKSLEYGTLFTVVNYEEYQGFERYKKEPVEQQRNSDGTATEQQRNNNKKDKKEKNEKEIKPSSRKRVYDKESSYYQLSEYLYNKMLENNPNHKKPDFQKWADDTRKMIEIDKRTEEQVKYLIDWSQQDSFWLTNIWSPAKLRKQFDQLVLRVKQEKEQKPSKQSRSSQRDLLEELEKKYEMEEEENDKKRSSEVIQFNKRIL